MRQQPEQFEPENRAPDTLIPNVMARLGLDASNNNTTPSLAETLHQLHTDDWQTRLAAVEALGRQHTQLPAETLLALLKDSDASVRATAVRVLGHTNDEKLLERLHVALHDPDWHVRETAVFVLGSSPYPPIELLDTAQSDEDNAVRDAATMMLQEIHGDQIVIQPLSVPGASKEQHNGHTQLHVGTQQTSMRQTESVLAKVYGYMNFLWFLPRTKGGRAMLREHTYVNENRQTETRPTRKAHKPMIRIVEGILAAVLILGLVASWLIVSQRFHTSTAGTVLLQQHLSGTFATVWSSDGKQIVLSNFGEPAYFHQTDDVYVWDIATNKLTKTLSVKDADAQAPGDIMLTDKYVSQAKDNLLRVWDTRTGRAIITYRDAVTLSNVEWSSDNRYIATNDHTGIVRIWNVETGKTAMVFTTGLQSNNSTPTSIAWSPDNKRLLVSYEGSPIQIWDPFTGTKLQSMKDTATGVAGWLNATKIMVADLFPAQSNPRANTSIRVWDAVTGRKLITYTGHTTMPKLFYSIDGRHVLSFSNRENLLWDSTTGKTILRIPSDASLDGPHLSPDGKFVEASDGINTVQIWDATTGKRVANYHVNSNLLSNVGTDTTTWFDPQNLISVKQNGEVRIFDAMTGQVRYSFDLHTHTAPYLQWSPDHETIAVALDNRTVEIVQGID